LPRAERGLLLLPCFARRRPVSLMERVATPGGPRQERETEMTFDEETRGWAFARAEGLEAAPKRALMGAGG
jgi:hypothetical protein